MIIVTSNHIACLFFPPYSPVFVPSRDMTEVMINSTPMEDMRLSPSKDRLSFQCHFYILSKNIHPLYPNNSQKKKICCSWTRSGRLFFFFFPPGPFLLFLRTEKVGG
uniref:Uncharacterized protein n=1 Tax=Amphilophus citrinellus TaxID=61819 RepID=A0A3Q0S5A2_AMPCI